MGPGEQIDCWISNIPRHLFFRALLEMATYEVYNVKLCPWDGLHTMGYTTIGRPMGRYGMCGMHYGLSRGMHQHGMGYITCIAPWDATHSNIDLMGQALGSISLYGTSHETSYGTSNSDVP